MLTQAARRLRRARGDRFDELLAAPGAPRPHWDAFMRSLAERGEREVERHALADRAADPRERHHLQRLRRREGRAPAVGGRPAAAAAAGRRVGADRGRHRAARRPAQPRARRRLRPAGAADERRAPAAAGVRPPRLPAPGARRCGRPAACTCCSTPPTWRARPTATGGWSSDRTQAPSGVGYALENRLVVSRVFPQMFRELQVQHLASLLRRAARRRCCAGRRAATARRASCC